eukprot:874110-Rhodomonas_salina.3
MLSRVLHMPRHHHHNRRHRLGRGVPSAARGALATRVDVHVRQAHVTSTTCAPRQNAISTNPPSTKP